MRSCLFKGNVLELIYFGGENYLKFRFTVMFFAAALFLCSCGVMSDNSKEKLNADTDPFEGVEISFYGAPEKGFADVNVSKCDSFIRDNFDFECENNGSLANGETASIKASVRNENVKNSGIKIIRYEKDYVVTGVDFYPTEIEDYEKEALNKEIRRIADKFISEDVKDFHMLYDSGFDRTGWSKSGSFEYTYTYYDIKMLYTFHKSEPERNAYFILYELENDIVCVEDMDSGFEAPMKKGEEDRGVAYILIGLTSVRATSDKIFRADSNAEGMKVIKKVFDSKEDAEEYCKYSGEYKTVYELFV